jgi:hypothetical protein
VREPAPGAAHAALHLVEPQQGTVPAGHGTRGRQVALGRDDGPGLALHRLQDHSGRAVVDGRSQGVGVAVRDERDVARQRLERFTVGGLGREGERSHGAAMERTGSRDQAGPSGAPGHLQRGLVGLGAGVREEDPTPVAVPVEQLEQPLSQPHLRGSGEEVRDMRQRGGLLADGLDQPGVAVTQRIDRDAGQQVQVATTVGVPHPGAVAALEHQAGRAERVHDRAW